MSMSVATWNEIIKDIGSPSMNIHHISSVNPSNVQFSVIGSDDTNKKELTDNLNRLDFFMTLNEGWDGYQAELINPELIEKVKRLVRKLKYQPEVFPLPDGGIQIEFDNKNSGDYLEFELYNDKNVEMYRLNSDKTEENSSFSFSLERIKEIVYEFNK